MRNAILGLVCAVVLLAGCRNAPATVREDLRRDVESVKPEDRDQLRARLRASLLGDARTAPDVDPHLRATAAWGLGDIGEAADAEVLLDGLTGPLADENAQVRMECAIALGKLQYRGPADERRHKVVTRLRDRAAMERDEGGKLLEREYMVRLSMVNSLVQIGGQLAAAAVYDVARQLVADLESDTGVRADIADKGLLDRCLEGLRIMTGVSRAEVDANRSKSDKWEPHLDWWATRVRLMPEN